MSTKILKPTFSSSVLFWGLCPSGSHSQHRLFIFPAQLTTESVPCYLEHLSVSPRPPPPPMWRTLWHLTVNRKTQSYQYSNTHRRPIPGSWCHRHVVNSQGLISLLQLCKLCQSSLRWERFVLFSGWTGGLAAAGHGERSRQVSAAAQQKNDLWSSWLQKPHPGPGANLPECGTGP